MDDFRIPPHDLRTEAAAIGSLLVAGNEKVAPILLGLLTVEDFYSDAHRRIFAAIAKLSSAGERVDPITIGALLRNEDRITQVGGLSYLTELTNGDFVLAHAEAYARHLRDLRAVRDTIANAQRVAAEGYILPADPDTVKQYLQRTPQSFASIALSAHARREPAMAVNVARELLDTLLKAANGNQTLSGETTGFSSLDECIAGLQPENLYILAARPSVGKTTFALNIAAHVARRRKEGPQVHVQFFSFEMSRWQLIRKLLAIATKRNANAFSTSPDASVFGLAIDAVRTGEGFPVNLAIDDWAGQSPASIRASVLKKQTELARTENGHLGLVVIDYLLLMRSSKRVENRANEIGEFTRELKIMANELQVPFLVLTQLNRSAEKDAKNQRPELHHLKSSGDIEQDANVVLFLWRPQESDEGEEPRRVMLTVAKNREGQPGVDIPLDFFGAESRFVVATDEGTSVAKAVPRHTPSAAQDAVEHRKLYWE